MCKCVRAARACMRDAGRQAGRRTGARNELAFLHERVDVMYVAARSASMSALSLRSIGPAAWKAYTRKGCVTVECMMRPPFFQFLVCKRGRKKKKDRCVGWTR